MSQNPGAFKTVSDLIQIEGRYRHIRPVPQLPNFAAYIEGVDLQRPLSDAVKAELYQALLDFEVLFFAPQKLTPAQHLELAAVFGPIAAGAYFPRKDGNPYIEMIENDAARPPSVDNWHSDITWVENPPAGTVIQITEVPPVGGNTSWASATRAFAALSGGLRDYLRGLRAVHTWEVSNWRSYLASLGHDVLVRAIEKYPPVVHPVIRAHPESGKEALFVNETFTRNIVDVPDVESREILRFLTGWVKQPEFVYTHRWTAHGIAVWDNRTTQHYALADFWPQRRVNQRVTFNARGFNVHGSQAPEQTVLEAVGAVGRVSTL